MRRPNTKQRLPMKVCLNLLSTSPEFSTWRSRKVKLNHPAYDILTERHIGRLLQNHNSDTGCVWRSASFRTASREAIRRDQVKIWSPKLLIVKKTVVSRAGFEPATH